MHLPYRRVMLPCLKQDNVDLCISVAEQLLDPTALTRVCLSKLHKSCIQVHLNTLPSRRQLESFDVVVLATYANLNTSLISLGLPTKAYHYELCEKPVVKIASELSKVSAVIMDGHYMCMDPLGDTGLSLLGNVDHAICCENDGIVPLIPPHLAHLLGAGIQYVPELSRLDRFLTHAQQYFEGLDDVEYKGSLFALRCVLPNVDASDKRPTIVTRHSRHVYSLWAGKIVTCIDGARQLRQLVEEED